MNSEIFVAEGSDEATGYIDTGPSAGGAAEVVDAGELTSLELDALQSTLTGQTFLEVLESGDGGLVLGRSDQGPWISRLRSTLTEHLAGMDESSVPEVATRWSAHEEVEDLDPATLADLLLPIVRLAHTSDQQHRRLYLWNRL